MDPGGIRRHRRIARTDTHQTERPAAFRQERQSRRRLRRTDSDREHRRMDAVHHPDRLARQDDPADAYDNRGLGLALGRLLHGVDPKRHVARRPRTDLRRSRPRRKPITPKAAGPEWQRSRLLPARSADSAIRWRHNAFPVRPGTNNRQLFNPVWRKTLFFCHPFQRLLLNTCYGLPPLLDGSLERRRHGRRFLVFIVLRCGQSQRRRLLVPHGQRESAQQRQPEQRPPRALRPASACCFPPNGRKPSPNRKTNPADRSRPAGFTMTWG